MSTWQRIALSRAPQSYHLALTEALLQSAAERPPLLYWQIAEPEAMVLGVGQKLSDLDVTACQQAGLAIYRRAAGGTAVLAGPDLLSLDVILPPGHPLAGRDIVEAYRWFGDLWAETLRGLGLPARTVTPAEAHAPRTRSSLAQAERQEQLVRQSCYGALSPYEVISSGRKIIGLDQVRRRVGFLFQAGLLLHWDAARLASLLSAAPQERPKLAAGLQERAAGIAELLERQVSSDEIISRFETLLWEHYHVEIGYMATIPAEVERLARGYEQQRYAPVREEKSSQT
jgi:lipoate-protein ligase A